MLFAYVGAWLRVNNNPPCNQGGGKLRLHDETQIRTDVGSGITTTVRHPPCTLVARYCTWLVTGRGKLTLATL